MDKNTEKKDYVVVRDDTGQKVSPPMTESEAKKLVQEKTKLVKESSGNAGVSVKQILHG